MSQNKKRVLIHLLIVVIVVSVVSIFFHKSSAVGGSWVTVGSAGFSSGSVEQTSLAVDSNTDAYIAFRDNANKGKLTVMKYDSSLATPKWVIVGKAGFSAGTVGSISQNDYYFSLKLDSTDTPYVAFIDTIKKNTVTVMKYNGKSWVTVGKAGFSSDTNYVALGIDSKDIPYVAFQDRSNGNNVTVMKYDSLTTPKGASTPWTIVGNAGFSGRGGSSYPSIAFDSNDMPYVGYADTDGKAAVMKYDTSMSTPQWVPVGAVGFSPDTVWNVTVAVDSKDFPYMAFSDSLNNDKATLMKYDGSAWKTIGRPGFSAGTTDYTSFVLDSKDVPYVGFMDGGNSFKSTVMKYDTSLSTPKWVTVGSPGFSLGTVWNTSLAVDVNNEVYIGFKDNAQKNKVTVMKYEGDGKSCETEIKSFSILGKYGDIDPTQHKINVRVPYGSKLTALTPSMLLSDYATVSPKANVANNFTKPQTYVVKGQNKSCARPYEVNVTVNKWEEVGKAAFTSGEVRYVSTAIDSKGVPYVGFTENTGSTYDDMSVMKYDTKEKKWVNVGTPGFTPGEATEGAIAIDPKSGMPYVAFVDGSKNLKLSVMLYDKNTDQWHNVGAAGLTEGQVQWIKTAFDSAGKLYVAFAEHKSGVTSLKVSVMKFDGKNWVSVGAPRFAGSDTLGTDVSYVEIAIDKNNVPYVMYLDGATNKPTVMKSNGKAWVNVGDAHFTPGKAETATIAMDSKSTPYVAFRDGSAGNKASVMKYDAAKSVWSMVGGQGFSATEAYDTSIKVYNNIPYVAFQSEWGAGARATVMKLNGTGWINVGNSDFSDGYTTMTTLAMTTSGVPYVAFQDVSNKLKMTVMRHP